MLSHLHGDHFDRVARAWAEPERSRADDPCSGRRLGSWGFETAPMRDWEQVELRDVRESQTVAAVPGIHARGAMRALLPPVMGSVIEHRVDGVVRHRLYVSGATVTGSHVDAVRRQFPDIDTCAVHLGGTRVLLHTVTMDAEQGSISSAESSRDRSFPSTTPTTGSSAHPWPTSS